MRAGVLSIVNAVICDWFGAITVGFGSFGGQSGLASGKQTRATRDRVNVARTCGDCRT